MTNWTSRFVVLCAFLTASASVYAHHSLAGVYSIMKLDVKNKDGGLTEWTFIGGSVQQIARLGLKDGANALKPGDEITVTIVPAIDGKSPVGLLSAITYKDGHTVRFRSPDE